MATCELTVVWTDGQGYDKPSVTKPFAKSEDAAVESRQLEVFNPRHPLQIRVAHNSATSPFFSKHNRVLSKIHCQRQGLFHRNAKGHKAVFGRIIAPVADAEGGEEGLGCGIELGGEGSIALSVFGGGEGSGAGIPSSNEGEVGSAHLFQVAVKGRVLLADAHILNYLKTGCGR